MLIAVDVGGTKIAAALVDQRGSIHGLIRCPTDASCAEKTLVSILGAVERTMEVTRCHFRDVAAIGLGIPGKVDTERGMGIASVNLGWRNVPVVAWLEERLHTPCFIENDVKVATLGERRYGVGQSARNLVFLSVGTGIAAGIIIEGELYRGATDMAGEIGHAVVMPNGPRCKCGTRGCLEAVATGPAIAAQAQAAIHAGTPTLIQDLAANDGGSVTAELVFQAAAQNDRVALAVLEEVGGYLGLAIFTLIQCYDPHLVVLGGGVSRAGNLILDPVRHELAKQALWSSSAREMLNPDKLKLTSLGQDGAILGAAALAERGIGGGRPSMLQDHTPGDFEGHPA